MPPQEIFGVLDVLRSILVHFGTLVHHGKVHVQINYAAGIIVDFRMSSMACLETKSLRVYATRAKPHVQDSKPVGTRDETRDDLSSLARCG